MATAKVTIHNHFGTKDDEPINLSSQDYQFVVDLVSKLNDLGSRLARPDLMRSHPEINNAVKAVRSAVAALNSII